MNSLYSVVSTELSYLEATEYHKASMVALSHALEDLVLEFGLSCEMFVTFQEFSFFLEERERYLELEQQGCQLFIFCRNIDRRELTEFDQTRFIELEADCPLRQEWDLIINDPDYPMVLLTRELERDKPLDRDQFRVFSGVLSFAPQALEQSLDSLVEILADYGLQYRPRRFSAQAESETAGNFERKLGIFLNRTLAEIEAKNNSLLELVQEQVKQEVELKRARQIHQRFLPDELPRLEGFNLADYYQPAYYLGGDFYNLIRLEEELIFYLVDITGHSLDGALVNIFIRNTINNFLLTGKAGAESVTPLEILNYVGQQYRDEGFPADYSACLLIGVLDLKTGQVSYVNAGLQVPVVITGGRRSTIISEANLPLSTAIPAGTAGYQEKDLCLQAGEKLVMATDGLIEADKGTGRYGIDRFTERLENNCCSTGQEIITELTDDLSQFMGDQKIEDDITILVIEKD